MFPQPAIDVAVPADQSIGLNDEQRLFPGSQATGQQNQQHPLTRFGFRTFRLAFEDNQLLAKEGVLQDKLSLTARQAAAILVNRVWLSDLIHLRMVFFAAR